jgi:hypothetical protein
MSIISYDFLELIHKKHNLFKLIPHIQNRNDRMSFERVFSILFYITKFTNNLPVNSISVFGCIHDFCRWGYTYEQYILDYNNMNKFIFNMKKIVKTWSGR